MKLQQQLATLKGLVLATLVGAASTQPSSATTRYWNGNASPDWANPNNFQSSGFNLPGVPQAGDTIFLEAWATQAPLLNNSGHAAINDLYLSKDMTISSGGLLDTTYFKLGQNASATLTVSGGALTAGNHLDIGGYNGGTATLNVFGGALTVGGFYLNLGAAATGASFANLQGGIVTASSLSINSLHPAVLDFSGGTLVVPSGNLGNVSYWIGNGNITAFGGAGTVNVDSLSNPGNLVISAVVVPEPSTCALTGLAALLVWRRRSLVGVRV